MKLYYYTFLAIIKKYIFRKNTGEIIRWFASKMGVVYIKFAQMLAMQNYGNIFTEEDRIKLSEICDNCNPIKFKKIIKIIEKEYKVPINKKFKKIYEKPVGAASISQVHKAILKNGDVVAIKVKRKDITNKIDKDIKQLKRLIHHFGKFAKFKNFLGSDNALNLYLTWIKEETDFNNEKNNLIKYYHFAQSVNGKVKGTSNIVTPKVYKNLCTDNIIVMKFINSKTINQMKLINKNKEKISSCLNDYISLSFYALFNDQKVIFHGDPHGGNIYIDKYGNVGFLDMGLIFELTKEENEFIRKLFFNSYNNKYEELLKILIDNSTYKEFNYESLKNDIRNCCEKFKTIPVTQFFVEMINVFTEYNINPPEILFKLAKAFVSLYGINNFINNDTNTENLLMPQIIEYYINKTIKEFKDVFKTGIDILPSFIANTLKNGFVKSLSDEIININIFNKKLSKAVNNLNESINIWN